MAAIKRKGYMLKYVKEQTPELCMEAVRRNENALFYIKE